jgi:hypothetical protein
LGLTCSALFITINEREVIQHAANAQTLPPAAQVP